MLRLSQIWRIVRIANLSNWLMFFLTLLNFLVFYRVFSKPNIAIKFRKELFVEQGLGNINFYQFVSMNNSGGKIGYVLKIEGFIRSKDRDAFQFRRKITGSSYGSYNGHTPFTEIGLAPEQSFAAEFVLIKEPDRVTRDSAALISSLVMSEYDSAAKNPASSNNLVYFNVSDRLGSVIDNFNSQRFSELQKGEYEYIIAITTDERNEPFYKCYSFLINPDNITQLKEITKDFKKYSKFAYEGRRLNVSIPLTEIDNKEIIASLKNDLQARSN